MLVESPFLAGLCAVLAAGQASDPIPKFWTVSCSVTDELQERVQSNKAWHHHRGHTKGFGSVPRLKMRFRRTLNFHSLKKGVMRFPTSCSPLPCPVDSTRLTISPLLPTESPANLEQAQPLQPHQGLANHPQLHQENFFPAEMGSQGPYPRLSWRARQRAQVGAYVQPPSVIRRQHASRVHGPP